MYKSFADICLNIKIEHFEIKDSGRHYKDIIMSGEFFAVMEANKCILPSDSPFRQRLYYFDYLCYPSFLEEMQYFDMSNLSAVDKSRISSIYNQC
jgi:hypothetical protein